LSAEEPSAASLAGLLADEDRRRMAAALILGAATFDDACGRAGLDAVAGGRALARLVSGGLVGRDKDGTLVLVGERFGAAARRAAMPRSEPMPAGTPAAEVHVWRAFVRDGRLVSIPTRRSKRRIVLDVLAQEFEPGRRYSEKMVDLLLARWYADSTTLRRYLVDEGFLDRASGEYWRAGGSVADEPS
jgi:hypothetical protein